MQEQSPSPSLSKKTPTENTYTVNDCFGERHLSIKHLSKAVEVSITVGTAQTEHAFHGISLADI